ncbi:gluconokinase [Leifsonia bigeumensis]|uniref:Gluconokinase n=2 Tax=Leifsonella bigeumensis TaxID=433643 RepID=A0ABP7FM98_9MICO
MLARELDFTFCDADSLHPPENVERMAAGYPLGDVERWPWLEAVGRYLADSRTANRGTVMACSALKHSYRDALRRHVPDAFFVFLDGPMSVVHQRIDGRNHEFMPPTLLASQYLSLEPLAEDERGIRVDIEESPVRIVDTVRSAVAAAAIPPALRDR